MLRTPEECERLSRITKFIYLVFCGCIFVLDFFIMAMLINSYNGNRNPIFLVVISVTSLMIDLFLGMHCHLKWSRNKKDYPNYKFKDKFKHIVGFIFDILISILLVNSLYINASVPLWLLILCVVAMFLYAYILNYPVIRDTLKHLGPEAFSK